LGPGDRVQSWPRVGSGHKPRLILARKIEIAPAKGAEGASVYPSLCLAGKRLVVGNDAGETIVLEPGDQGAAGGSGSLPGGSGGTPAFSGQRMLVRGGKCLYCLAAPAGKQR